MKKKKAVSGQIIGIFITILLVSVLAGMTFLFVGSLKTEAEDMAATDLATVVNESSVYINGTNFTVANAGALGFRSMTVTSIANGTMTLNANNYTVYSDGNVIGSAGRTENYTGFNMTYSYYWISADRQSAYKAINQTESSGMTVVNFLTILFLAMIFSAILTVVLRIVLPFMNVSKRMEGF